MLFHVDPVGLACIPGYIYTIIASGTNGTPLDIRFSNWALELRRIGYDPVLFGYTHTSMDPRGVEPEHPGLRNDEGLLPGIRPIIDMGTLCPDWRAYLREKGLCSA